MIADNRMIGRRIKQRREQLNISQEKLGEMIGVTYQQIQKYEKGSNKVSAERLSMIAKKLRTPINFFFEGTVVSEEREDKNYSPQSEKHLSSQEQELLNYFRFLPDKDAKANLIGLLRAVCKMK